MALGALVVAVWCGMRSKTGQNALAAGGDAGERMLEKRVESRFESPSEEAALDMVKRGLAIREPATVEEFFHPGSASPEEVVDFLRKIDSAEGRVDGFAWLSSMDANGLLIDGVLVRTILDGKVRSRMAFLTPDEQGKWKIDFNAFARTVEPSWSELLEMGAAEGTVRVNVAKDTYYNGPFGDDRQWVCYGMVSPDTEVVMLGYCRKDSPQARAMERIVMDENALPGGMPGALPGTAKAPKRATLAIRRVEGAESRQFEITRVLAQDWVLSETPFDGDSK
jgi:hypothetical protein